MNFLIHKAALVTQTVNFIIFITIGVEYFGAWWGPLPSFACLFAAVWYFTGIVLTFQRGRAVVVALISIFQLLAGAAAIYVQGMVFAAPVFGHSHRGVEHLLLVLLLIFGSPVLLWTWLLCRKEKVATKEA